jgi:hypothetical protein
VNVGSRFFRAGFTGTRGVLVSAVPSAGVGGPASVLGGPGIVCWILMGLSPAGEVDRGNVVAIGAMSAPAGEHPVGQRQIDIEGTARGTELARRIQPVGDNKFAAAPALFISQLLGEFSPTSGVSCF